MQRIVIGFDGSSRGDDALALGRTLARAAGDGAEVIVAAVYKAVLPRDSHGSESNYQGRLRFEAGELLDRARAACPELGDEAFETVRAGSPAAGLHRLAQERAADVIVVGSSHRAGIGRIFAGSATEQVLSGAPAAVAVAPPGYARTADDGVHALERIAVAYDGAPEARHALREGAALARATDATLVPISVVDTTVPVAMAFGYEQMIEAARERAHADLTDAAATVADAPALELIEREGEPAAELAEASREVDLLVAGSRGYGPVRRLLLGSVSTLLVRQAACPLLLLPRAAVDDAGAGEPGAS